MEQEKVKPQVILELEEALGVEVKEFNLDENGEVVILNLAGCQIYDISPLFDFYYLTRLELTNNRLTDIAPLLRLRNLEVLDLSDNNITDISPLSSLINLERVLHLGEIKLKIFRH